MIGATAPIDHRRTCRTGSIRGTSGLVQWREASPFEIEDPKNKGLRVHASLCRTFAMTA